MGASSKGGKGRAEEKAGGGTANGRSAWVGATYQPSVRSNSWLKVKRDYLEGMADTLDLVPIGGWWGNGRKAGWLSPILMACYDPRTEEWQSVCRVMSGFTDAMYARLTAHYGQEENQVDPAAARRMYSTGEECSVWFKPMPGWVWEVKGADLTLSPVHGAAKGLVHPSRGISLRFPRFVREREDKGPEDASTSGQVAQLYRAQTRKVETGIGKGTGTGTGRGLADEDGDGDEDDL